MQHGIALRAYHLLHRLKEQHEIRYLDLKSVACRPRPMPHGIARLGQMLRFDRAVPFDANFERTLRDAISTQSPDLILAFGVELLPYALRLGPPVVADLVDESALATLREARAQPFGLGTLRTLKRALEMLLLERRLCVRARVCFVVAAQDARWLRTIAHGANVCELPNGVDIDYFAPVPKAERGCFDLVFSGNMEFPPNVAAVHYFAKSVFPLVLASCPESQWYIVGRNPLDSVLALREHHNIHVTGFVTDIRPFLARAAVVVSPLISGGGIKNKILEAWAMRKAIVATPLGCAGVQIQDGVNLEVARNARQFAAKTVNLLQHPERARKLGEAGYRMAASHYSWADKARQLETILYEAARI
jgi:glycosyltransferase involved in cell wall biosynthesis